MMAKARRCTNLFILSYLITLAHGELFTAIAEMEPLLHTHKRILDDLEDYLSKEEQRLTILKRHLDTYKREHDKAMQDIPNYLGNPINAFTLIKRLTTDLDDIEQSIKIGTEYIKNLTMNHADVKYPTVEDLAGAAQALTRLQITYELNTKDVAEGKLNGIKYSAPMSVSDCYELGRALYNEKDFKNALSWMLVTLEKYREEKEIQQFRDVDIMEYIGFCYFLTGDIRTAFEWTNKLLEIDPKHPRAAGNIPHYKRKMEEEDAKMMKQLRGDIGKDVNKKAETVTWYSQERKRYEALCRGEVDIPMEVANRLTCRYMTENHPFLRLAPLKMEYVYLNPDVVVFHNVMSDDEIEHVKEMAKPRFKRAVVHDPKTGELVPAPYRISKSGWLRDSESDVIARISRRVSHMTSLSMTSAEELQVVNYGIGGHYEPHYDFARKHENAFTKFNGNRIATVLFYMSDVGQGGATVFTELGAAVAPRRGAALYWRNLHRSGEGDLATRHAACPVLHGSKWVSNKWIHQGGQEFIAPCSLEYQKEEINDKLPKPIPKTSR